MKRIFLLLTAGVLAASAAVFASGCKSGKPEQDQMSRASYYNDLIKEAVNISPEQLGLKLPDDKIVIYGVITEQNIGDLLVIAAAAYGNGEAVDITYGGSCFVNMAEQGTSSGIAGLLFSNAQKYLNYYEADIKKYWKDKSAEDIAANLLLTLFIDSSKNEEIRGEVKKFMELSQNAANSLTETEEDGSIPAAGNIKIIFLTNKGRYFVEGAMSDIKNMNGEFGTLFRNRGGISDMVYRNFASAPVTAKS
jgi:hypothetical protein